MRPCVGSIAGHAGAHTFEGSQKSLAAQGTGFSEAVAALEAEVRALRTGRDALAEDNKAAACTIRAKDKQLDVAAACVEDARLIGMENKARLHPIPNP